MPSTVLFWSECPKPNETMFHVKPTRELCSSLYLSWVPGTRLTADGDSVMDSAGYRTTFCKTQDGKLYVCERDPNGNTSWRCAVAQEVQS